MSFMRVCRPRELSMDYFAHERLDVYGAAIAFLALVDEMIEFLPKGRGHLADQLERAATSITFNVAEGAGEFASHEKARIYRIARRSATECAAILDVCRARELVDGARLDGGRELLLRIVAMLTKMILAADKSK
jgi:four helix bundle protein